MAQADKTDKSSDQNTETKTEITEDVVDAEIIEDIDADADDAAPDLGDANDSDTSDTAVEEDEPIDAMDELQPSSDADEAVEDITDESAEASGDEAVPESAETDPASEHAEEISEETPEDSLKEPQATTPAEAPVKKTGFVQVVLGGAIAAALGFGAAFYVSGGLNRNEQALQDLTSALSAQSSQIEALRANQTAAQKAADDAQSALNQSAQALQDVVASVDAVNARIDDATAALTKLDGRLTVMEKRPITQGLPSSAIEAYEREVEELKAAVASQREDAAAMEENARLTAQQTLARAALTRILSALDTGAPFRVALTDYGTATGDIAPAALEALADTGAPTLVVLQDTFPEAARAALASARETQAQDGNRLTSFLKTQLGARSVTPQEGSGADAILSRAEDALRAGQIGRSLQELSTLPEAAQAELAAWTSEAEKRRSAIAAGEALSQQLNAN